MVVHQRHARYVAEELAGLAGPHVLMQPADRGTAAAVLLAAHWISWQSPGSVVAVFPSDHFVQDEAAFMSHIRAVAACVRRTPERLVLLGAAATEPEPQYGWIEPGARIGRIGGEPLCRVRGFVEKPSPEAARVAWDRGDLWNTFVVVGAVAALLRLGWTALPALSERLASIQPMAGTGHESAAIAHAYVGAPKADFCRDVFQPYPSALSVSRLPPRIRWSDWGTPERVITSLRAARLAPAWLRQARPERGRPGLTVTPMRTNRGSDRKHDRDRRAEKTARSDTPTHERARSACRGRHDVAKEERVMWQLRSIRWVMVLLLGLQSAELRAGEPFDAVSNEVVGLQWAAPGDTVRFRVTMSGGTPGALVTIYEQQGSSLSFTNNSSPLEPDFERYCIISALPVENLPGADAGAPAENRVACSVMTDAVGV